MKLIKWPGRTLIVLAAASVLLIGCAADDAGEIIIDSDTMDDTDSLDAAMIRDALDTLLTLAPESCKNFCQSSVDCQFAVGEIEGSSSDVDLIHAWTLENCVVRCTYPLIEGSYLYQSDPTSGEQTVERIVGTEEYAAFTDCLEDLDAHICLDGIYQLSLTDDLLCGGLTQCLAGIDAYNADCQWTGTPEAGNCSCDFTKKIPDFEPWLAGVE